MKNYVFVGLIVAVLISFVLLSSCADSTDSTYTYSFRQDQSNIEKVEVCAYDSYHDTITPLAELNEQDADALLAEISALPCYKSGFIDFPVSYGEVVISITYFDSEIELIGLTNIGWIKSNGVHCLSRYFFDRRDVCNLILKYVDAELLPDLSEHLE